jgi:hypothetical protein
MMSVRLLARSRRGSGSRSDLGTRTRAGIRARRLTPVAGGTARARTWITMTAAIRKSDPAAILWRNRYMMMDAK